LATFFLLISAVMWGWLSFNLADEALSSWRTWRQKIRLSNLLQSQKTSLAAGTIFLVGNRLPSLSRFKWAGNYALYLSGLLQRAGRGDLTQRHLVFSQIFSALVAAAFVLFLTGSLGLGLLALLAGGILPLQWLRDQAGRRERALLSELPNALEILSLCSEAGLSLEQSMEQYLRHSKPGPLQAEFTLVLGQTQSGSSRKKALESSASRLHLTDYSLFCASLIQAERFGTGVSKILRQLSLTTRDKQTQRAEKTVQEMPVKMLVPLILFIMPVTFLIIFGPILLQFFRP